MHFAVPKTASKSARKIFLPHVDFAYGFEHIQPYWIKEVWPESFDSYFKFCFVRNPWDRILSHYFFLKENFFFADCGGQISVKPAEHLTFLDFINVHLCSEDFCVFCEEQICWSKHVDYVARFENYEEEIHNIFNLIGIKKEPIFIHENKTTHKPYTEYYDDKSIMIVYEKFKTEIEMYNYEFG
jgi:hypothetical protein